MKKYKGGKKNGNKILLIGGVHGNELTPICFLTNYEPDDKLLKNVSCITVINAANIKAIKKGTRETPVERNSDLNRAFKEKEHDLVKYITEQINKHNVIIDIHSSPNLNTNGVAVIDIDSRANCLKKWCDKSEVLCCFRYFDGDTIKKFVLNKNKLALTLESDGINSINGDSMYVLNKCINSLIENSPKKLIRSNPTSIKSLISISAPENGLAININFNRFVKKGEYIGDIQNLEGRIIKVKAPSEGFVIDGSPRDWVNKGGIFLEFQPL